MLVRIRKGGDQRPLSQLHALRAGVLFRQRVARVEDAPLVLHQVAADVVALVDGEDGAFIAFHRAAS